MPPPPQTKVLMDFGLTQPTIPPCIVMNSEIPYLSIVMNAEIPYLSIVINAEIPYLSIVMSLRGRALERSALRKVR